MSSRDRKIAVGRLWLILAAAFLLAAVGGGFVVFQSNVGRALSAARLSTARTGNLLALSIYREPYGPAQRKIKFLHSALPGIRRAEIIVPNTPEFLGWDGDLARRALVRRVQIVTESFVDRGGVPTLVAYTPFTRSDHSTGLIAVELEASEAFGTIQSAYAIAGFALLVAAVLAGLFASSLTRQLLRTSGERSLLLLLQSKRHARRTAVEISLGAIAATVSIGGIVSVYCSSRNQEEWLELEQRHLELDELRHQVTPYVGSPLPRDLELLANQMGVRSDSSRAVLDGIKGAGTELLIERDRIVKEAETHQRAIALSLMFASLLTLSALALARATARREDDLEAAESEAQRLEAARRQIVDSLPIGFYSFGDGRIGYCNDAWRGLVGQAENEEPIDAFERALHPEERDAVLGALADAIATGSGFGFGHRLVTQEGEVRHVESRGVPIFDPRGRLEHVVGFTLDVTARVKTRQLLETKTGELEATNARLRQALSDLEDNFEAMVLALVKAVEAKDPYTAGHSERVMGYSVRIGHALGLSPKEIRVLRMGSLIHDVGKIGVPDSLLTKPARLTEEEYLRVQAHPSVGAKMVEGIPMFRECVPIVLLHHERLDGSGYPTGARDEGLPLLVRIVAVADCFDAMTSTRAYRNGMPPDVAIAALRDSAAKGQLDGKIVEKLAEVIDRYGPLTVPALQSAA
jgi:PAS domain S-box-containing protein